MKSSIEIEEPPPVLTEALHALEVKWVCRAIEAALHATEGCTAPHVVERRLWAQRYLDGVDRSKAAVDVAALATDQPGPEGWTLIMAARAAQWATEGAKHLSGVGICAAGAAWAARIATAPESPRLAYIPADEAEAAERKLQMEEFGEIISDLREHGLMNWTFSFPEGSEPS